MTDPTRESLLERRRLATESLSHFEGSDFGFHLSETIAIIDLALRALDQADDARLGAAVRETETPVCSVCCRPTGFGDEDKGEPPVNLARCPAPGGMECRAVARAVAPWRRENETLRSNCDHLSSENASLSSQVESMGLRIESLAEELAKPEDVRLREVVDALDGRAVIFDALGARVGHLLDEMDEWIARAGEAERRLEARRTLLLGGGAE